MDKAARSTITMGMVQALVLCGMLFTQAIRTADPLWLAATIVFAWWFVPSSTLGMLAAWLPDRYPMLRARSRHPWPLRLTHFESIVAELRGLGFVDVGVKDEHAWFRSLSSRELWHPEHGTYASIFSFMLIPSVSFLSSDATKILHSTLASAPGRFRSLIIERERGTLRERLAHHVASLAREGIVPDRTGLPLTESHATLLQRRLEVTRRYYLARFGTDAVYEREIARARDQAVVSARR